MTKPTWIVCNIEGWPLSSDDTGDAIEHKSEKAAIAAAKEHVNTSEDDEAWIYRLSHVVSRPNVEPNVEVVK